MVKRSCALVSAETGERLEFSTVSAACDYLGHAHSYIEHNLKMGCRITHKLTREEYYVERGDRQTRTGKIKKKTCTIDVFPEQLCARCGNFAVGCEWSERLQPVPGWTAFPTRGGLSYCITDCPKFVKG